MSMPVSGQGRVTPSRRLNLFLCEGAASCCRICPGGSLACSLSRRRGCILLVTATLGVSKNRRAASGLMKIPTRGGESPREGSASIFLISGAEGRRQNGRGQRRGPPPVFRCRTAAHTAGENLEGPFGSLGRNRRGRPRC